MTNYNFLTISDDGTTVLSCDKNYKGDLVIPNCITEIGKEAFKNCKGLTSVKIPYGVTKIRKGAFYGCSSLTSVEIPFSVKKIGNGVFERCTSLTFIKIQDSAFTTAPV